MRRLGRILIRVWLTLTAVLLCYVLAAWILGSISTQPSSQFNHAACNDGQDVYVVSNGVHLNLVLPITSAAMDWRQRLPHSLADSSAPMVQIGWGSRVFYTQVPTWGDLNPKLAVQALLYDDTVLAIEAVNVPMPNPKTVRHLDMCLPELRALSEDIAAQLASNRPLTGLKHYYPAKGHYSPLLTCNEWMRQRLRHRSMPLWSPFAYAVLNHLPQ